MVPAPCLQIYFRPLEEKDLH